MFKNKKSKYITGIILMLALIEMSMIFVGTYLQKSSSRNLQKAYRNQLKYRDLATELKNCSDYLTDECRSFAVTGDIDYFRNYWNEAKNEMHREKTIEEIEESNLPDSEQHYLERAKYFSDTLMHIEISSMRLTLESQEITADQYEESADQYANPYAEDADQYTEDAYQYTDKYKEGVQLQEWISEALAYPLEEGYQYADNEKQQNAAKMLYSTTYESYKKLIDSNIQNFQKTMNARLDKTVEDAKKASEQAFFLQLFFGMGEIAVLVLILVIFDRWYIKPVNRYKKTIERQHGRRRIFVEPEGVWELQQFAEEFNALSSDMLREFAKSEQIERELMDTKRQAEKANQVKTQFLTQMSHELRTPLNTISGYLYLLEDTKMSGEQRRYTENMHLATDILLEEINEILDYSKLESGRMIFENKNFSLRQLTDTLQSILENEAEQRNLSFEIQMDENLPEYIQGDPLKLKQVLTNLVYNSFKFTKEGGVKLMIHGLHFSKTMCVLEFIVEDTGIGIKKEQRQAIFEAFAQADESITRKYGGTGLGLPICRKIVQEMSHGKYSLLLESEEGKGSRFFFDMDFAYGKKVSKKKKKTAADKKKRRNLSILIVDDNRVNLIMEAEILHKFGYLADVESDAEQVLKRMGEKKYDLVFLDISMPKISGYELSRQIRKEEKWKDTVIIALTANIGEEVKEKVKEAQMNAYLPKPVPMEKLKELLEEYTDVVIEANETEVREPEENAFIAFHQLEKQFYDDKEAVIELLMIFAEDNEKFEGKLRKAAEEKNWEQMEMEVHRIKGVSGNLLCKPLEKAAKECLENVKKKKWKKEQEEQLYTVLKETLQAIERYQKNWKERGSKQDVSGNDRGR